MCSQPGGLWTFITHGLCQGVGCPRLISTTPTPPWSGRWGWSRLMSLGWDKRLSARVRAFPSRTQARPQSPSLLVTYLADEYSDCSQSFQIRRQVALEGEVSYSERKPRQTALQIFSWLIHPREATFWQASEASLQFHQHNDERWASRFCAWLINIHVDFTYQRSSISLKQRNLHHTL